MLQKRTNLKQNASWLMCTFHKSQLLGSEAKKIETSREKN
jgi:hypothetical protein